MASNNKMKGLLKGLRYISQIFDNEKEPEMQIGYPTDVKHVAHIGWDGPSVNSPSWMNEFKGEGNGEAKPNGDDAAKWSSEDASSQRGSRGSQTGRDRDLPDLPKSARRHSSTGGIGDSPTKEKSEKSEKKSRKSSRSGAKDLADGKTSSRQKDGSLGGDSSSNPSDLPKKARRKKSKDASGKSSRSKAQAQEVDCGSEAVSQSLSIDNCETASTLSALEEDEAENGFTEVS
ncbi:hypothetical protein JCGZ_17662 [Jatropha curcas]|uniref:CRIB domain-containing protein n=1 Tax=Jatropha curcas TaxID=180498 RepID=A0A067K3W4_JATCU|nr:CRIB domain-containing protein RIC6 [Jatropha curcas]KDP26504.1 hypothetical protein JCGZ_17662 [Jatropha curcas]